MKSIQFLTLVALLGLPCLAQADDEVRLLDASVKRGETIRDTQLTFDANQGLSVQVTLQSLNDNDPPFGDAGLYMGNVYRSRNVERDLDDSVYVITNPKGNGDRVLLYQCADGDLQPCGTIKGDKVRLEMDRGVGCRLEIPEKTSGTVDLHVTGCR